MTNGSDMITQLPLSPDAAWRRYLDRIRRADDEGYERVEQDAWDELQATLRDAAPARPLGAA